MHQMITNKKESSRSLMIFSLSWVILIVAFAATFFISGPLPSWVRPVLIIALVLVLIIFYTGGFFFIRAEKKESVLEIKYYNLFPVGRKFQAMQVPLKQFHHYEIKESFGGWFRWMILFQEMRGGIAKFPRVGLSAVGRSTLKELEELLGKGSA